MGGFLLRDRYTPRAQRAWVLAGLSAPAALTLAGLSWHWVLLGSAAAAIFYYIIYRIHKLIAYKNRIRLKQT